MRLLQKSTNIPALRTVFIQMVDEADHLTPKAGLNLAVQIVKAGEAAYGTIDGSWSEIGSGTYAIEMTDMDVDTEGGAMLKITATGACPQYVPVQIVRFAEDIHLAKAALVNQRTHTIDTGVDVIMDDDGVTALRTMTPAENNGVITVVPS